MSAVCVLDYVCAVCVVGSIFFPGIEFRIAVSGMAWKGEEGDHMVAMQASDIKWAQWIRVARNYQLRVGMKDRSKETFDGFVREVSHRRSRHFLSLNIDCGSRIMIA